MNTLSSTDPYYAVINVLLNTNCYFSSDSYHGEDRY